MWGKLSQVKYAKQIKPRHFLTPLWKLKKLISWENRVEQEVSKVAEQEVGKGKRWSGRKFNNRNQMPTDRRNKMLMTCSTAGWLLFTIYSL